MTDYGCLKLQENGLPCHNETSARPNCIPWDTEGNSCEPFPVPPTSFADLFVEFLLDPNTDATTRTTNYDKYYDQIFVAEEGDFEDEQEEKILNLDLSCRTTSEGLTLYAMSTQITLDQGFEQSYEDGIDLFDRWEAWATQMLKFSPREMDATMQTSNTPWYDTFWFGKYVFKKLCMNSPKLILCLTQELLFLE